MSSQSAKELGKLDATAQAKLVRDGEITPEELVDAAISRLEALNPKINAVIHPCLKRARRRAASTQLQDGPFRGVPFAMKDIGGDEEGQPQCAGMRFLKDAGWKAPEDAYFTEKTQASGLVSIGRTNTPELALMPTSEPDAFGPTRNPWNTDHSSGGSSGGASAVVAAGIVPAAHASDGGGSIRGPASMCGLVGLKPTRGRNSFGPGVGERWSGFSSEFVVSRTVRDSAALLDVTSGAMPGDPHAAPPFEGSYLDAIARSPGKLRVGLMRDAPRDLESSDAALAAVDATAKALESLGHEVEESHPSALQDADCVANYVKIVTANIAFALDSWGQKVGRKVEQTDVEPMTWALAAMGNNLSAVEHLQALGFVHSFGRRLAAWWQGGFDLLLTPTQAEAPPEIGFLSSTPEEPLRGFIRAAPYGVFTLPFNLSGQPAISVPSHWTANDLPVGSQLVAATGREDLLLQVAAQLEEATPWADRWPSLVA